MPRRLEIAVAVWNSRIVNQRSGWTRLTTCPQALYDNFTFDQGICNVSSQ